jgi:hypothetical protein
MFIAEESRRSAPPSRHGTTESSRRPQRQLPDLRHNDQVDDGEGEERQRQTAVAGDAAERWARVLERARRDPDAAAVRRVARALSSPLMLGLAASGYTEVDADELLDETRFATTGDIEALRSRPAPSPR